MFIKAYIIHNNSKDRYLLRFNICEILKKNMIKYQMISQQEEVIVSSNNFANRLQFFYFCFMRFEFDLRHKIGKRKLKGEKIIRIKRGENSTFLKKLII